MKKLLSCLLALSLIETSSFVVSAVETAENGNTIGDITTIVAVNEENESYLLSNGCSISQETINQFAEEEFIPKYGDLIYINAQSINPLEIGQYVNISRIEYLGTAEEYYNNTKKLTVTEEKNGVLILEDTEQEKYKLTYNDYAQYGYTTEIDPADLEAGTTGLFVVNPEKMLYDYDGIENEVILPLEITQKTELVINPIETYSIKGDASGNGKMDILDVIIVNKAVLGKEELTTEQVKLIDFNGNGKPDAEDSLTMMKYIVGLIH